MGFSGTFVFSDDRWAESTTADEYLSIEIHDSDFAAVEYSPSVGSEGRFYLGIEPRHYFDDPGASQPVDAAREATSFQTWAAAALSTKIAIDELQPLLADSEGAEPETPFVEDSVIRLVTLLGLPLPPELDADG